LRHGGQTTANVPFCIYLGWDQRRHVKSHPFFVSSRFARRLNARPRM